MPPTRASINQVAKQVRSQLGSQAFITLARMDLTDMLRTYSQEPSTRLKSDLARQLEIALLEQGVRCYPPIDQTTTGDSLRFFHPNTRLAVLVGLLASPGDDTDAELLALLRTANRHWGKTPVSV